MDVRFWIVLLLLSPAKLYAFQDAKTNVTPPASEQDASEQDAADQRDEEERLKRSARLDDMRRRAEAIEVSRQHSGQRISAKLLDNPLLRFNDTARLDLDGTVWAWGEGRPAAIMELYPKADPPDRWVYVFTSTSPEPLDANIVAGAQRWNWSPGSPGFHAQPFPDAPPPADRPALRLRQMKELARRLTAHEFWDPDNSRFELRLLAQPVHRYQDPEAGITDAAIFLLAHGTNPEVVAIIEAAPDKNSSPRWQCAFMRLGHAEMHVEIDGRELWRQQRASQTDLREPYWLTVAWSPPEK
ncbi:MAG TPA: hypothetical protein VJ783_04100 [Pirellulales bacterium]|nr:hypothetical protein [Pirellulales bacterium]